MYGISTAPDTTAAVAIRHERRHAVALATLGAAPFLVARVSGHAGLGAGDLPATCLFRATTGLPCPTCGATRALMLAGQGDTDFLHFNAFWVAAFGACALAGAASLALTLTDRSPLTALRDRWLLERARRPRFVRAAVVIAALVPWAWALANREAITAPAS
jgi:hypothetical protein